MKVLDATFLIDYLHGDRSAERFYAGAGGRDERWIVPVPAYAEVIVGVGNVPGADSAEAIESPRWGEVYTVDERTAVTAAEIAEEIGPEGPYLGGMDALVAAVGRELDAPVVSADGDLTHPETKRVVDVEEYRPD
jgi:predicted nucleic acid-binding protein